MIDYFSEEKEFEDISKQGNLLCWVSKKTTSLIVYKNIAPIVLEKEDFISRCSKEQELNGLRKYTISAREIARKSGLAETSVTSSTYIGSLNTYLNEYVNKDLIKARDERVKFLKKKPKSRGVYESPKKQLVDDTLALKKQITKLEKLNAEKQIDVLMKRMRPELRKVLFGK